MSSTPTTPTPTPTATTATTAATAATAAPKATVAAVSTLAKDWTWLGQHVVLLLILAGLTLGGVYEVENIIAKHDAASASRYEAMLNVQAQQTQTLQKQLQTDEANWSQVEATLLAQNASLAKTISARNQQISQSETQDATLSAAAAASKIADQTKAAPGEVVANQNDVDIDLPIARRIASSLDLLPVAQANLADTQKELSNETTVATNAQADATAAKGVIASQTVTLADETKSCNAQITALKAANRKSKIKSFFWGVGVAAGAIFSGIIGRKI